MSRIRTSISKTVFAALLLMMGVECQAAEIRCELSRQTYARGEAIPLTVTCENNSQEPFEGGYLSASIERLETVQKNVPRLGAGEKLTITLSLPTRRVQSGRDYPLEVRWFVQDRFAAKLDRTFTLVPARPKDPLDVWMWVYGGPLETVNKKWNITASELGINVAGGPVFPYSPVGRQPEELLQARRKDVEQAMRRGADVCLCLQSGVRKRDFDLLPYDQFDEEINYRGAARNGARYLNPFDPRVAEMQNQANRLMTRTFGDFPNVRYAFIDMECVDDLSHANQNESGQSQLRKVLGFGPDEAGGHRLVAPGVIADDDKGYRLHKYIYQSGNGINLALQRAGDELHKIRPDVRLISDPFRSVALLDMFPGCDIISTWTYSAPDPKLMLYTETLRAACRPKSQIPLHVVTLVNYPGEVVPESRHKGWMMMGPDRLLETTWINLSRAPQIVGYYAFDSYYNDDFQFSMKTMETLTRLSKEIFKPYGAFLRQLEIAPRKIAVLTSESSHLYGKSPGLLGYPNYQATHFYTVLSMAHLNADVVFDETIERNGLDQYSVLVLPKCDVLTQSVHDRIAAFQQRGGIVISDQYLGARLSDVIKFAFDFSYRKKVNANAIASGKIYVGEGENDHLIPSEEHMKSVLGVTAAQDQVRMETYAKELRAKLHGKVDPEVFCDRHDVLLNVLQKGNVRYLVIANDRRGYDDRTGPYKAILERLIPQTVTIHVRSHGKPTAVPYDLLRHAALSITPEPQGYAFQVQLGDLGGTIISLSPEAISGLKLAIPSEVKQGDALAITGKIIGKDGAVVPGVHPCRLEILNPEGKSAEYSADTCTHNGELTMQVPIAANDSEGEWSLSLTDLTSGHVARHRFTVRKVAAQ